MNSETVRFAAELGYEVTLVVTADEVLYAPSALRVP